MMKEANRFNLDELWQYPLWLKSENTALCAENERLWEVVKAVRKEHVAKEFSKCRSGNCPICAALEKLEEG